MNHAGDTMSGPEVRLLAQQRRNDPLHRFTSTPYTAALPVMDRRIHLESNRPDIVDYMMELFTFYPRCEKPCLNFRWRIVSQADMTACPPWPKRHAFSDDGLRFVEFGQRSFIAVDLEACEAVAFIAEGLLADKVGFTSPFLDNLFCMTASSLSLTSLRANCVAFGRKGLLVFGTPNCGKTSASYLATKIGLEFYADEGVFAEIQDGKVRAWSGFWPAVFRPAGLEFYPELQGRTQPLYYRDSIFHHLSIERIRSAQTQPVTPTACVFLERRSSGSARVSKINPDEFRRLLLETLLFQEDERFSEQHARVLAEIANVPAYRFTYASDPAAAADFFLDVLHNPSPQSR